MLENIIKNEKDIELEAVNKITEILKSAIESGNITMEMLEDKNFAEDIVNIYLELESQNNSANGNKKGGC